MKAGFTGTQIGMSAAQLAMLRGWLLEYGVTELHHGDCTGADDEAAALAASLGIRTVAHPPLTIRKRAFHPSDEIRSAKDYLARDRDIVNETEILFAAPRGPEPRARRAGGTWYTVRYARRLGQTILIADREEP